MGNFISKFNTTSELVTFSGTSVCLKPHVSLTKDNNKVYFFKDTRVVGKYNVTTASSPTQIGYGAFISGFSKIEIDGVALPNVVSSYTFSTTGIHTVKYTLTDMTSIGDLAFAECTNLTSIVIPNSVTSIGMSAFYGCSGLTSCTIGSGVTSIGNSAFYGCSSLSSITIPNSVTSIDVSAFYGCTSLSSCTIGSGVTSIGNNAFRNCSGLTNIICNATTAPTIQSNTFQNVKTNGTLYVPSGSTGYNTWMQNANYYLGLYSWTKVER